MRCSLHVGTELVRRKEHVPTFVSTGTDGEGGDRRTRERDTFRCPVPGCIIVAVDYDPQLKTPLLCRMCRKTTLLGTSSLCPECGRKYRAAHPEQKRKRIDYRAPSDGLKRIRLSQGPA
jgi:hypothetical protein